MDPEMSNAFQILNLSGKISSLRIILLKFENNSMILRIYGGKFECQKTHY